MAGYVSEKKIRTVIQFLTAELIKNEPENPIAFLHELTGQHLQSSNVDDLLGESIKGVSAAKLKSNLEVLSLERVSQSLAEISRFKLDDPKAVDHILSTITELTNANKCFLHFIDADQRKVTLSFAEEAQVCFGEGIVGQVAESRVSLIKGRDDITSKILGEEIVSTCASPFFNSNQEIVGVVQLVNKEDRKSFNPQDLLVLSIFCSELTVFTSGSFVDHQTNMHALVDLLETVRSASHTAVPISSLIFTITRRTAEMIGTDRCTLFVVDPLAKQMWSMQGEINIRIPINAGIAGTCATTGEIINIEDAYQDERFNPAFDRKSGYHTTTILCIPMKHDDEVVGVLQLINKLDGVFTDDDAKLLTLILDDAATTFSKMESFQKGPAGPEMPSDVLEVHRRSDSPGSTRSSKQHSQLTLLPLIEETDDCEDAFDTAPSSPL